MRLVAWNQRYQQMFNYPPGMLYVGRHVADLIRFNAERGKIPYEQPEDIEDAVRKRINYMRAGTSHVFQRTINNNKQVIELRGRDRKSTRLNSSHVAISYAVFCLKKKKKERTQKQTQ